MKKRLFVMFGVIVISALGFGVVHSQGTEPPSDLPLVDATATATAQTYATATEAAVSTATATPLVNEVTATDDADTGAEVYVLAGLSVVAGLGIYSIKKYFDIKRYSI